MREACAWILQPWGGRRRCRPAASRVHKVAGDGGGSAVVLPADTMEEWRGEEGQMGGDVECGGVYCIFASMVPRWHCHISVRCLLGMFGIWDGHFR